MTNAANAPRPIEAAASQVEEVQRELEIAGAELHLTNIVLGRSLPDEVVKGEGDAHKALAQNGEIEEKVVQAAEDLAEVKELLQQEMAERRVLERRLAEQAGR